jgi:alpha-glucosidase
MIKNEWWRGAVIYQIYPRSFNDSNGDGIGDLKGITEKISYIQGLGVDAIWISPFFKSPMKDFGYDVEDYRAIDPMFGTLEDFDLLLEKAHSHNLKIIIDMVLSHTSDQHSWFQESRSNRTNPKAKWYVWADPEDDGSPPNNWQSVFGGPSWKFDIRRGQYYLHNFLPEQPDLNIRNPEVRAALKEEMRFWLERGVDGFRLDAINFAIHDPTLKDNPPAPGNSRSANFDVRTPDNMQEHIYDRNHADMPEFLEEIRSFTDRYENRFLIGEVAETGIKLATEYTRGEKRLHSAYNFSLLVGSYPSANLIRGAIKDYLKESKGQSWPSWAFSNHDVPRVASRWHPDKNGHNHDPRLSKMLMALLAALRGNAFVYQGEELGLPSSAVPFDQLQDPWALEVWPEAEGRDISRTPVPWNNTAGAGFTDGVPWLPIEEKHKTLGVECQEDDPGSTLNFTRHMLAMRRKIPAFTRGDIEFSGDQSDDRILSLIRSDKETGSNVICVFNMSDSPEIPPLSLPGKVKALNFGDQIFGKLGKEKEVILPPYGVFIGEML